MIQTHTHTHTQLSECFWQSSSSSAINNNNNTYKTHEYISIKSKWFFFYFKFWLESSYVFFLRSFSFWLFDNINNNNNNNGDDDKLYHVLWLISCFGFNHPPSSFFFLCVHYTFNKWTHTVNWFPTLKSLSSSLIVFFSSKITIKFNEKENWKL